MLGVWVSIGHAQVGKVLYELHKTVTGGHLEEPKVLDKLKERLYQPGDARDVRKWYKTCGTCSTQVPSVQAESAAPDHFI